MAEEAEVQNGNSNCGSAALREINLEDSKP